MSDASNREEPRADPGERGTDDARSESAPRRVGEVRQEREAERETEQRRRENELGTSWTSVIFGLLAALGASLILSGIVGGVVGAILGLVGVGAGTAALIGLLVTLFVAFLIGGYVAGRMASRSGVKHGLFVPLLLLVLTILLAITGSIVGYSLIDNLSGVTLPQVPGGVQQQAEQAQQAAPQNLGTILTVSGILALLVPFIGGAIGGGWGAKTGRRRP